jgi:quercetin dioxygenase-like cupin family protein
VISAWFHEVMTVKSGDAALYFSPLCQIPYGDLMFLTSSRFVLSRALLALSLASLSACALMPGAASSTPAAMPVSAKTLLETSSTWDGKRLAYPQGTAKVTALEITVGPGAETGWHQHPVPSLAYMLEGELEVALRDGTRKRIRAGEAVAEVIDTDHNGRNPGSTPARLVVFYVGTVNQPLTVHAIAKP